MFQDLQDKTTGLLTFTVGTGAVPAGTVNFRGLKVHPSTLAVYAAAESVAHASYLGGLSFDVNGRLRVTTLSYGTVELDGVSGTYVASPDSAAASVTADIDLVAYICLDDWTPGADSAIFGKFTTTAGTKSYLLQLNKTSGVLRLFISSDGTAQADAVSTVAPGFTDGTSHWVRATWSDSLDDANFYTSDDPAATDPDDVSWTQLGNADLTLVSSGIADTTTALEIGSLSSGTVNRLSCSVHKARVYNGISGVAVVDFNAADAGTASKSGSTSDTVVSSLTGEVWTLAGGAEIYMGVPYSTGGVRIADLTGALYIEGTTPVNYNNSIGYSVLGKVCKA